MITRENLKDVLLMIPKKRLKQVYKNQKDWLLIQLFTFNTGVKIIIENKNYHEKNENLANENGQLFIHKDHFLELLYECKINF